MSSRKEDDQAPSNAKRASQGTYAAAKHCDETPEHLQECLRIRRVVRKLLRRDMKRRRLSLRGAAREGRISIGTLSSFVNSRRLNDPKNQPKRGVHRGTILHLRGMRWIGGLTTYALDRLLEADELGHRPRAKDR